MSTEEAAAPKESSGASVIHQKNVECMICSENAFAIFCFPCGHFTCYSCGLRIRRLKQNCPVCRNPSDGGVLTATLSVQEDQYSHEEVQLLKKNSIYDNRLSCHVESKNLHNEIVKLYQPLCPLPTCWVGGYQEPFASLSLLKQHLRAEHGLMYCRVCLERRPLFLSEQSLYNDEAFRLHKQGLYELDHAAFSGHPECLFCSGKQLFLDGEDLLKHMLEKHFSCDFCNREQFTFTFFDTREKMYEHFHTHHNLCEHPNCAQLDTMLRVYRDEFELDVHRQREHHARPATFRPGFVEVGRNAQPHSAAATTSSSTSTPGVANGADITVIYITFDYVSHHQTVELAPKSRHQHHNRRRNKQGKNSAEVPEKLTHFEGGSGLPPHFLTGSSIIHEMKRETTEEEERASTMKREEQQTKDRALMNVKWGSSENSVKGGGQHKRRSANDPKKEANDRLNALLQKELPWTKDLERFKQETRLFMNASIKTSEYFDTLSQLLSTAVLEEILPLLILTCPDEEKKRALTELWKMRMAPERLRQEKARQEDEKEAGNGERRKPNARQLHVTSSGGRRGAPSSAWGNASLALQAPPAAAPATSTASSAGGEMSLSDQIRRIAEELSSTRGPNSPAPATFKESVASPQPTLGVTRNAVRPAVVGAKLKSGKSSSHNTGNVWSNSAMRLCTAGSVVSGSEGAAVPRSGSTNAEKGVNSSYSSVTGASVGATVHRDPQPADFSGWAAVVATSSAPAPTAPTGAAARSRPPRSEPGSAGPVVLDSEELFPSLLSSQEQEVRERVQALASNKKRPGKKKPQFNAWFTN